MRGGRYLVLATVGGLLLGLAATSHVRRIGDGSEYLAMALQLASARAPSIAQSEIPGVIAYEKSVGGGFGFFTESFDYPHLLGSDGRRDFAHFWFYSALAAPGVALARMVGMHPNVGFVLANVVLFLVALGVAAPRVGWAESLLLFLGPVVWWIDKAHTEVFTFSLLGVGLAPVGDAPWWSMVAFGAAATQNLPIAIGIPLVAVVTAVARPARLRDRRFWLGIAAGLGLGAMHPLYYLARLGVPEPQMLVGGVTAHVPRVTEMGAFVWDPNIGILPNFPALALVCAGAIVLAMRRGRHAIDPDIVVAVSLALVLLVVFAQTPNVNSGGTPGPARYGLWLIPLAIPILAACERHGGETWRRAIAAIALVSGAWALVVYHPRRPETYLQPTRLAAYSGSTIPASIVRFPRCSRSASWRWTSSRRAFPRRRPRAAPRSCSWKGDGPHTAPPSACRARARRRASIATPTDDPTARTRSRGRVERSAASRSRRPDSGVPRVRDLPAETGAPPSALAGIGEVARDRKSYRRPMTKLAALLGLLVLAMAADAARVPGEQSNAFTGQTSHVVFRGRFRASTLELFGRVRCRGTGGCPARVGRLTTTCVDSGGSYRCTGTIAYASNLTCTVDGYYYTPFAFEATYECPSVVGALSLRKP
jgi:hypothetical protein